MQYFTDKNFENFINELISSNEFKKLSLYIRAMKLSDRNGTYQITHEKFLLKYNYTAACFLLQHGEDIPLPLRQIEPYLSSLISKYKISQEELLWFSLGIDDTLPDDQIFGTRFASNKKFIACFGDVLFPLDSSANKCDKILKAITGKIEFTNNFRVDNSRLLITFLCFLIDLNLAPFESISDLLSLEEINQEHDKYSLTDVSNAEFDRQGFTYRGIYYLYSIFLNTSIASPTSKAPQIIELFKNLHGPYSIFLRCDKTLGVPESDRVSTAGIGFEKWRGVPLNFANLEESIHFNKEVIVHFAPDTMHKILMVIKPECNNNSDKYYNISIEELWNPNTLEQCDKKILTNFIHGCYYLNNRKFDHIDLSVNEYDRIVYEKKYQDAESQTSVSIEQYSELHYKVWCVRGNDLTLDFWAQCVYYSLSDPFRPLFLETLNLNESDIIKNIQC